MKISKDSIEINRDLSDLDKFTLEFITVLSKYTNYVIISGYVAILLGRSRASEDVDIIVPKLDKPILMKLIDELYKKKFYCLNTDDKEEMYDYLGDKLAIRFAKINTIIPNMELKFSNKKFDVLALTKRILVKLGKSELYISHLELQVAFKEAVLKSPKDLEDARHIRNVAKEMLDVDLINKYKRELNEIYR